MVNKSLGYLQKNLLEMKYLEKLMPFVPHGERKRLNDVDPFLLIQVVGRRGLYSSILNTGSFYILDTTWMSCTLRRMFVKASLEL